MTAPLLAAVLALLPYEPHIDCAAPQNTAPAVVSIAVTDGGEIRWNHQHVSRAQFEDYLRQLRSTKSLVGFRIYRDNSSAKTAAAIIAELKHSGIPFAKNCLPIP